VKVTPLDVHGAYLVELEPHTDERGSFARIWCRDEFVRLGLDPGLAQASISRNTRAGTLRGMHYQRPPHEEVKLVRCTRGAIFDVVVDLRPHSPTRGTWFGAELDADRGTGVYVPAGCAHGFQTLVDETEVLYLISRPYVPDAAAGVRWDDPAFGIHWPDVETRTVNARDRSWPDFSFDAT
jgi:dTDP-4-dehydrorhamnose 3,5-epimerase